MKLQISKNLPRKPLLILPFLISSFAFASVSFDVTDADVEKSLSEVEDAREVCLNMEDNQNTSGQIACTHTAYQSADDVLNKYYQEILKSLSDPGLQAQKTQYMSVRRRIVESEKAWITFRDANSQLAGISDMGTPMDDLDIQNSLYSMTVDRVRELEKIVLP
jgi:uncharacterized protein YecT (DUF1311 family)